MDSISDNVPVLAEMGGTVMGGATLLLDDSVSTTDSALFNPKVKGGARNPTILSLVLVKVSGMGRNSSSMELVMPATSRMAKRDDTAAPSLGTIRATTGGLGVVATNDGRRVVRADTEGVSTLVVSMAPPS
jgi:hypothetical protein